MLRNLITGLKFGRISSLWMSATGLVTDDRGAIGRRAAVTLWSDRSRAKVFTTRDFSKSGGPTGELFHSGQDSPVAKFRFDQSPGP
jgi:hypothetical protein